MTLCCDKYNSRKCSNFLFSYQTYVNDKQQICWKAEKLSETPQLCWQSDHVLFAARGPNSIKPLERASEIRLFFHTCVSEFTFPLLQLLRLLRLLSHQRGLVGERLSHQAVGSGVGGWRGGGRRKAGEQRAAGEAGGALQTQNNIWRSCIHLQIHYSWEKLCIHTVTHFVEPQVIYIL